MDLFVLVLVVCLIYTKYTTFLAFFREVLKFSNYNILSVPYVLPLSEVFSEPTEISEMEFFKAVNSFHKKIDLGYLGSE